MASINFYERSTIINRIEKLINQINQRYFEGNYGILSITDNSDYVTVSGRQIHTDYDTQKLFDALEDFSKEDYEFLNPYDLWDYLDHCKYQDNNKPVEPFSSIEKIVSDLTARVYELEQEVKQLKKEKNLEPKPEKKPTTKKQSKFKLPENFADYQQECDDLIEGLSCLYNIKKGKWNGNILQFILTPTDTEKAKHPYPDKWKAGLYLQPGQWTVDKVSMSDPDDWEDWFMDINDFADANDIEIS